MKINAPAIIGIALIILSLSIITCIVSYWQSDQHKIDQLRYALEPFASYVPDGVTFKLETKVLTFPTSATEERTLYAEDFVRAKDVLELTK